MTAHLIQGSSEWLAARCGRVTASRVADVVARTKTGWGASRATYMAELLVERMTGQPAPAYVSPAMQHGTDCEPYARAEYVSRFGVEVYEIGLVPHPEIPMAAASPDGLVGDDGLVEFKCPTTATHLETLLGASPPDRYIVQVQWQLACTDREWADLCSYDPRVPEPMRLHVQRIKRDPSRILSLEHEVGVFLAELDAKEAALRELYAEAA